MTEPDTPHAKPDDVDPAAQADPAATAEPGAVPEVEPAAAEPAAAETSTAGPAGEPVAPTGDGDPPEPAKPAGEAAAWDPADATLKMPKVRDRPARAGVGAGALGKLRELDRKVLISVVAVVAVALVAAVAGVVLAFTGDDSDDKDSAGGKPGAGTNNPDGSQLPGGGTAGPPPTATGKPDKYQQALACNNLNAPILGELGGKLEAQEGLCTWQMDNRGTFAILVDFFTPTKDGQGAAQAQDLLATDAGDGENVSGLGQEARFLGQGQEEGGCTLVVRDSNVVVSFILLLDQADGAKGCRDFTLKVAQDYVKKNFT